MLRKYPAFGLIIFLVALRFASAQASPTATRDTQLQIGAGATHLSTDYGQKADTAISIYGDYDFAHHLGLEGNFNFAVTSPTLVKEDSYLAGPRFFVRRARYLVYVKAMGGLGTFDFNSSSTSERYFVYAFGGGLDVYATRRIHIRAIDLQDQQWPSFTPHSLSPITVTIGAAYSFR